MMIISLTWKELGYTHVKIELPSHYVNVSISFIRSYCFISKKAENKLINFAKRFSYGLNLVLVMGLVILGITVLCLFAYDLSHIFYGDLEKGLLATLGSLLMLWVVIELMGTKVRHLKGAKFSIKVFIGVAMVTVIRKILVTSLQSEAIEAQVSLVLALAVLGMVYWIVVKTEKMES